MESLQEQFAAQSICFGCGPANEKGLQIRSFVRGVKVVAEWHPRPEHQAFPGMLNGGIIGALLDCNCNWAAAWFLMQAHQQEKPDCTVTASYNIKLLRPTPVDQVITISSQLINLSDDRATIAGELSVQGKCCATCEGVFVAVKPGHPAYHRW